MKNQAAISKGVDKVMILFYFLLITIGFLCIFSVEHKGLENVLHNIIALKKNYSRQLLFMGMAIVVAILILLTDSKFFTATANISYMFGVILMMEIGRASCRERV